MAPLGPLAYARRHRDRFLAELKEFVRFPTVSSQQRHADDLKRCAGWLANQLRRLGMERVELAETAGPPIVYAEWKRAPERPTLLVYGHYDVVPPDPLRQWCTPPFDPSVRGGNLYGRGACDDKGQLFAHVKALESYLRIGDGLPVNVKCVFEGEEEVGSPHLESFIARNTDTLRADVAVISDTRMLASDRPAISYAQRGLLSLDWEVRGPEQDLHSGNFGGAVCNPVQALCEMIAKLHDSQGRVAIPGFYDDVRQWSEKERADMARTGPGDRQILANARVEKSWGERGYSLYERTTLRPALTLNGVAGGYRGSGGKAIIPARARAKLSFRLVPDQRPKVIERLVRQTISRITPPTVTFYGPYFGDGRSRTRQPRSSRCSGRIVRVSKRIWIARYFHSVRRHHSGGQYFSGNTRDPNGAHGICLARRPDSRSEREVSLAQFLPRNRDLHLVSLDGGPW